MDSLSIKKVVSLLQRDFSEILQAYNREHFQGILISVSEVRISPDLGVCKVYVSVFPTTEQNKVMESIQLNVPQFRFQLGNRIRKHFRITPELQFYLDTTLDKQEEIDELLKGKGDNPIK